MFANLPLNENFRGKTFKVFIVMYNFFYKCPLYATEIKKKKKKTMTTKLV